MIRAHPVGFDPRRIPAALQDTPRLCTYSVLSRAIRNLLRRRNGQPISTAHIARKIAKDLDLVLDTEMRARKHNAVLK